MELDTLLLDFYGLTLIHLTDPLSQVVQIMYVICNIYIYIYIYWKVSPFFFLEGTYCTHAHTWTEFLGRKGKSSLNPNSRTIMDLEQFFGYQWRKKWLSIA